MEEESDDTHSFVIALDSDQETDSFHDADSDFGDLSGGAVCPRASSPTWSVASLSSLRRRAVPKRPAPNPPDWNLPSKIHVPPEKGTFTNITQDAGEAMSYKQQSPETHVEETWPRSTVPTTETRGMSKFATHPIHLVTAHATPGELTRQADTEGQASPCLGGQAPPQPRLHWIDDVVEPLSPSSQTPAPAGAFIHSSLYSGMSFPRGRPNPYPISTICADLSTGSAATSASTAAPFYLGSVTPGTVAPLGFPPESSHPYERVSPLSYFSHFSPVVQSAPLVDSSVSSSPQHYPRGMRVISNSLPLSHSASDPGVHRMLRGEYLVSPLCAGPSLDRLSEDEEKDDADHATDDVFRAQNYSPTARDLIPGGEGRRPRSDRYDSIGSPLVCEDLLVSAWVPFKVTFTNLTMVVISVALLMPNSAAILYSLFRLVFGTLFPAYYSYKAVRTKNVKEYVKWMMYWIVFAFFTCVETITDVFLSFWFPFYYEIKILVVLWLLSPATRGSSILYRKFVHPWLTRREEEIDECIAKAKQQGYSTVVQLGTKGVNYATSVIMQTAIKGGGGLVSQLKRSYSASEIGEDTADHNRNMKSLTTKETLPNPSEEEDVISVSSGSYDSEPRHRAESESLSNRPRGHSTGRSIRAGKTRSADVSEVDFHETSEVIAQRRSPRTHDAGRYTPPYREQLPSELLQRRDKHKYFLRPKSMTIGGTSASREAWLEARRKYSSGSFYTNSSESPLESSSLESSTPPRDTVRRNVSRSFRSSLR